MRDHGYLLNVLDAPRKAKQYVIGNALIAVQMTYNDIRAGLYAPLRVLVYETIDDQSTLIEFDQPSSLFGQFHNSDVNYIAENLDAKLEKLIEKADSR